MVKLIQDNKSVGVVGPKLVFPPNEKGELTIQSAGGQYDVVKAPFHRYLGWLASDERVNKTEKVSWITGAALLTPRDLFERVGCFDPAYGRGYYDDPDYCEKIKELGYEVWYQPQSTLIHKVGQSMGDSVKTEEQQRSAAKSFRENAARFHSKWDTKITPDVSFISGAL